MRRLGNAITYQPAHAPEPVGPAGGAADSPAEHIRNAAALLLTAERGRAVATVEQGEETIRLGMVLLSDASWRAIGARLLAALDQLEGRA